MSKKAWKVLWVLLFYMTPSQGQDSSIDSLKESLIQFLSQKLGQCQMTESDERFIFSDQNSQDEKFLADTKAIDVSRYQPNLDLKAMDQGFPIDLQDQNHKVSQWIKVSQKEAQSPVAIIVPGYTPQSKKPIRLDSVAKRRLNIAVQTLIENPNAFLLTTGGNVEPQGTPFNESLEMKKHLISVHQVPERRIAIEPYARNSIENLHFSGRFLLAHNIEQALIVTTKGQNLYFGRPWLSGFHFRSYYLFGYKVGDMKIKGCFQTEFRPNPSVMGLKSSDVINTQ